MYGFIQDVPITEDLYAKIMANIGPEPMAGLIVHLAVRQPDKRLRYIDVWESKEACSAVFEQRIHPAVLAAFREAQFRPAGEPTREEIAIVDVTFGKPT
jgi:hypothetical protein